MTVEDINTGVPDLSKPKPKAKKTKKRPKQNWSAQADKRFGEIVRSIGMCESGRLEHKGNLQCAHGFSRRYRTTRWDLKNAWCLCAGCHKYYTERPLEWDDWLIARWGRPTYEAMRFKALAGYKIDTKAVLAELKAIEVSR